MSDKAWKRLERKVCKDLGGYRSGPTGRNDSDCRGIDLSVECKYQKRLSLRKADIEQAKTNAKKEKQNWIMVLKEAGGDTLAVIPWELFIYYYNQGD